MDREEKAAEVPAPAAGGQEKKPGRKRKKEESQDLPLSELPVTELKGVGPQQQARLAKLGIVTVQDLLFHLPVSYEDRTRLDRLSPDIFFGEERVFLNLAGKFITGRMTYGRKMLYRGEVKCDGGILNIVIFNARPFQVRIIESAGALLLYGEVKPGSGGGYEMIQPEIQSFPSRESITLSGSLTPNYPLTEGINQRFMRKIAGEALDLLKERGIEELIPEDAMKNPVSLADALRTLHAPPPGVTDEMVRSGSMPAQRRLIAEELAAHHISILEERARNKALRAPAFRGKSELEEKFLASLPFTPTRAQERVSGEIAADLRKAHPMMRLVQGDVGSGKTLVAARAAIRAISAGCQVALMAPTELLAEQHAKTFSGWLSPLGLRVTFLSGSLSAKERRSALEDLILGRTNVAVGTHALFQNDVMFKKLGLIIIDEQHRFGVAQRAKLWMKNSVPPHVLVMTATPIPRTLAMTLYGDLDVSVIDELPPGRKPIRTVHMFDAHRPRIYQLMNRELQLGRQIYIVYPLIKETEKMDLKDLEAGFEEISKAFPGYKVSKVHGKMKPADKDAEMQRFANHETHILVSTTVIEVGVNVPNASVMIIENAERFGLSQLHQLRGRVGRGADQSYCVLVTKFEIGETTRKRIQVMVDTTDGFEIAEQDLKLRGPGDLEGTQQSGMAFDLKIANLARDGQILTIARDTAQAVIASDPEERNPQNDILWRRLRELRKSNINWGAIS